MSKPGVLDLSGLSESDLSIVQDILARYVPNRPVFVFGSRANGRAQRRSDLDLAVGGTEPLNFRIQGELADAFDESDLPIEVDVVDLSAVSETFRKRIMSEWIELIPAADRREVRA
jgi:predicted nucleotidyltransferase